MRKSLSVVGRDNHDGVVIASLLCTHLLAFVHGGIANNTVS